ncbi:MAG: non-homologous end-joining DNA ligase [Gaiellaceae bacterium]|jgi:bifunctional non-homologous end joining protein LigD
MAPTETKTASSPDLGAKRISVRIGRRQLSLSNLDKVLYPASGLSKGEVIDYYTRIAPVMLPHLKDRPLTFRRFPHGVEGDSFFAKNVPAGAPEWVQTVKLPSPGSSKNREQVEYVLVPDLATLVWAENLAALELHAPMWRLNGEKRPAPPDLIVFDLDPGPPATIVECCRVAELIREILDADGLSALPKTSGKKGLQLYVPLRPQRPWQELHLYARRLVERLEREYPRLVVSSMRKDVRRGKVLVDWSQNNAAKTTIAVYSLRASRLPAVSTPLSWDEVERCRRPEDLVFGPSDVLERVERRGDLFAPRTRARSVPV